MIAREMLAAKSQLLGKRLKRDTKCGTTQPISG
jgi:hypothetical protein